VLARDLPGPDDLLLGPDHSIYLSDVADGTIKRITQDGHIEVLLRGLAEPEGMVFLPDHSLVIVEQGLNRLVRYNLNTKTLNTFLDLENKTGKPGVDGIALQIEVNQPGAILIPDSPNGRILEVSLDGKAIKQIGAGFVRPTGVWVEPDRSLLVVDEDAGTLSRLRPDGSIEHLANLPTPDDVVEDRAGNIFINTLGDGAIHWIKPGSTRDEILIKGFSSPQGLILDAQENLIVTDAGHHQLDKVIIR
jgi:sugar lactone lactonase YvrE